jgi:putative ABC transport system substrate-binding protein
MTTTDHLRAIIAIVFLCLPTARTLSAPLLVVYPEAPEPYREAFAQMVDGIARTAQKPLLQKTITATTTPDEFRGWLSGAGRGETVVLLGHKALSVYGRDPPPGSTVLVGGISALPGQTPLPGISLTLDPALYLQALDELLPDIRRIVVYCNTQERSWIAQVEKAAKAMRIDVESVVVTDAFDAARQLGTTFKTLDPKTTALWFGRNTIALNADLLYSYVLEQTWDRNIAVFSETVAHVRGGFLFALYPDYAQHGAELGALIRQGPRPPGAGLRFSRAGQLALNARTARHLGITPSDGVIRRAKPLFPEP